MAAGIRLFFALALLAAVTLVLLPVQVLAMFGCRPVARAIPVIWHRMALAAIGVRVHVHGPLPRAHPLLIVANHLSWSDILVLGSVTKLCFVAKREVKSWPGINLLAWLQRTVFVDSDRRHDSANQADTIAARLSQGDTMVLFAEGTTGDGHRVGSFKSALFGAVHAALRQAHLERVTVQPVAIAYTRLQGLPLGRLHQARASWPGDVPLGAHLVSFLLAGAYDVDVVFGEASTFTEETGRKQIAVLMHARIRAAFTRAMRMRLADSMAENDDMPARVMLDRGSAGR
ncbi:MAG: lysophospholipid acyltransferase family protein [Pseudomonadota bacterium]|nr:lysophospholipid acyltransferase family protein [Pseudomonadota bacterium]